MADLGTLRGASPLEASDNNRLAFTNDLTETLSRALDDTPADLGTVDTLLWRVEARLSNSLPDDTYTLQIRIVNGTTILAAADAGGTFATVANLTGSTDSIFGPTAFAYVNTTATKATWDGALIELRQNYTQNMGKDARHIEVDDVQITGTYSASVPPQEKNLTPAAETEAAQALVVTKPIVKSLTPATEADSIQALVVTKPIIKSLTPAIEGETAQALSISQGGAQDVTVTPASETESAQALEAFKQVALTPALEAETAQALVVTKPIVKTLTPATETETAQALSTSQAGPQEITLTPALETDEAVALSVSKPILRSLVPGAEIDEAKALSVAKVVQLQAASETEVVVSLSVVKPIFVTLNPAIESDSVIALDVDGGVVVVVEGLPRGRVPATTARRPHPPDRVGAGGRGRAVR